MLKKRALRAEDIILDAIVAICMLILVVVTLYPFLNTVAVSFNAGIDTIKGGIFLWPRVFTLNNYKAVFYTGTVFRAFFISVARTVISTILNLFLTTMLAYALSRREYVLRKPITVLFVLTMYFNAGIFPIYFLMKSLGLYNNFWVYIVPSMVYAFNMIVIRTYIRGLPESMIESAKIDGAGDFRIFLTVIFPLCKPVLATVALFVAVGAWNMWFDTFLYCSSNQELSTLQYELMKLLTSTLNANQNPSLAGGVGAAEGSRNMITPLSIRAAITIVAAAPIILIYPSMQKYFISGMVVGSVKE